MTSPCSRLSSLPKRAAAFVEPMECEPVSNLRDGPGGVYEVERIFRVGNYGKMDGLDCIWLVDEKGNIARQSSMKV